MEKENLEGKKLDCDNQAKFYLKRSLLKGGGCWRMGLCFILLFKVLVGFVMET